MGTDAQKAFVKQRLRKLKAAAIKYGASLKSDTIDIEELPFLGEIRENLEVSKSFELVEQFAKLGVEVGIVEAKDDLEASKRIRAELAQLSVLIHDQERLGQRFYKDRHLYGFP